MTKRNAAKKALGDMAKRGVFSPLGMADFHIEIEREGARGAILMGSGLLHELLRDLLIQKMPHLSKEEINALYTGYGPLSSFSSCIRISYAFSVIGKDLADDLHTIRELRNAFAHSASSMRFETTEVAGVIDQLKSIRRLPDRPDDHRKKFIQVVDVIGMDFIAKLKSIDPAKYPRGYIPWE